MPTAYGVQSPLPLQYKANTGGLMPEIICLVTGRNAIVKCLARNVKDICRFISLFSSEPEFYDKEK
jgi:hypothetical protein